MNPDHDFNSPLGPDKSSDDPDDGLGGSDDTLYDQLQDKVYVDMNIPDFERRKKEAQRAYSQANDLVGDHESTRAGSPNSEQVDVLDQNISFTDATDPVEPAVTPGNPNPSGNPGNLGPSAQPSTPHQQSSPAPQAGPNRAPGGANPAPQAGPNRAPGGANPAPQASTTRQSGAGKQAGPSQTPRAGNPKDSHQSSHREPQRDPHRETHRESSGEVQQDTHSGQSKESWAKKLEELNNELLVKVAELEVEKSDLLDSLRRVQADFENYRKRVMKQEQEVHSRAEQSVLEKILPALDTIDLALAHLNVASSSSASSSSPVDSVQTLIMLSESIHESLAKVGLDRIVPVGEDFDPERDEAVAREPNDDSTGDSNTQVVSEVMRAGYKFKGKVIRPAMVKVRG